VEVLLDDISAARIEALGFLTQLDPVRDIMMLAWKANGYTVEAIGQKVGVNEKTVRRRLDAITIQSKDWIIAYGERAVGLALSEIIRETGVGENFQ
jgi:predicted transcriptional regulator